MNTSTSNPEDEDIWWYILEDPFSVVLGCIEACLSKWILIFEHIFKVIILPYSEIYNILQNHHFWQTFLSFCYHLHKVRRRFLIIVQHLLNFGRNLADAFFHNSFDIWEFCFHFLIHVSICYISCVFFPRFILRWSLIHWNICLTFSHVLRLITPKACFAGLENIGVHGVARHYDAAGFEVTSEGRWHGLAQRLGSLCSVGNLVSLFGLDRRSLPEILYHRSQISIRWPFFGRFCNFFKMFR